MIKIEKLAEDKEKLSFLVKGISTAIANAIRRNVFKIPTLAIDSVEFYKNDSALYDEIIAHRLGLIPLHGTKTFTKREECSCKGKGCLRCTAALKLKAKGPCTVYASDLKGKAVEIVYPGMPIVILAKDQELELSAEIILGTSKQHAKFSPGLVWFNAYPIVQIKGCDGCGDCVKVCSRNAITVKDKKAIIDPLKCDMCNACVELKKECISIEASNEDFIFFIESFGHLKPKEIFFEAIEALDENFKELDKKIKKFK